MKPVNFIQNESLDPGPQMCFRVGDEVNLVGNFSDEDFLRMAETSRDWHTDAKVSGINSVIRL